ncbi:MAG: hypothetical protein VXV85_04250 [Candidatus Thermoplasmatota archaeon]|nr:hypothetical protein [Candidatus Thermoplasmatota archaeon]
MGGDSQRGPLTARIWLTFVVFCQIFLTPLAAFSITYLLQLDMNGENITIGIQREMLPWIMAASLSYGMLALLLALIMGGYQPIRIVERGGWKAALGMSRGGRSASSLRRARETFSSSPHGSLSTLVNRRMMRGHSLISTHGGLLLLAVPFQILLVTIPLTLVMMIPESIVRLNRRLELSILLYIIGLLIAMRLYPRFCRKYIGIATFTRRWLISMTKLSWLAPVLVLWLMGRFASLVVLGWMGQDTELSITFEANLFEAFLGNAMIPETSFLDLLTALAVMPLAAFTTLAVLEGGSTDPPDWMRQQDDVVSRFDSMESPDFGLLGKVTTAAVSTTATLAVAAAAGVASKGQDITTGLSAMAAATPSGVDALASTTSNLNPPSLPSLEGDIPLDLPEFDNSLLDVQSDDTPPYDQPTIQGLISDEHRSEH